MPILPKQESVIFENETSFKNDRNFVAAIVIF
jgi:hypothetical protein